MKNLKDIKKIKQYLLGKENKRDYMLFVVGIKVGLRAGDLLSLKISDVLDAAEKFKDSIIHKNYFSFCKGPDPFEKL